jgi:hypothetical protein
LLEAINAYFDNKGGVYVKPNEMAVVTFKSIPILEELIIPFFLKYPLLSAKSYEFEKWCDIVKLLSSQNHIGKTLTARDAFLDIAKLCSDLNSKRNNPSKVIRAEIVKEWLESLTGVPSIEAKAELQARIQKAKKLEIAALPPESNFWQMTLTVLRAMLEPYAMKVARMVLRRGKTERSYLFQTPDSANTSVDV